MTGVISPTNLSLYSSSLNTVPRSRGPRWNNVNSFIMEDDFHTISHPGSNSNVGHSILLMDEGKKLNFILYVIGYAWILLEYMLVDAYFVINKKEKEQESTKRL